MDKSAQEVTRIMRTYESYERDPAIDRRWSDANPGNAEILRERDNTIKRLFDQDFCRHLPNWRILEVGCGRGRVLASLEMLGAAGPNLFGVDLRPAAILAARQKYPELHWYLADAQQLPFNDRTFDCVLAFTVFSSILNQRMAQRVAAQIQRVLRPNGLVLWYDFRVSNPFNRAVKKMPLCDIQRLFPGFDVALQSLTLIPPLARRLGRGSHLIYPLLTRVPFLRSHYCGFLRKCLGERVAYASAQEVV